MLSEVADEWVSTTLKEAASELFTDGDWVESKDQDPDGEVRLIQLADIGDGLFLDKSARFLTADKARELRCTFLRAGDLLIARMADPIARCCIFPGIDQPAATVVDVSIVRPGPDVDREYLGYAVSNPLFRSAALGSASGTTRSRISRSNLGSISLPLPPLDDQRRIAEVLRSVDAVLSLNMETARHLWATRKQALAELFVASEDREAKATLLGPLRPNWQLVAAEEVCEAVIDCKNRTPPITEEGPAVVRTMNVRRGRFVRTNLARTDAQSFEEWTKRGRPQVGDVLITREAPFGEVCAVPQDETVCLGQRMMLYRPRQSELHSGYLLYALQSAGVQEHLLRLAGGSTVGHVRVGDIRQLPLPLPEMETQVAIAGALADIDLALDQSEQAVTHLQALKSAIASALLSGRVRVPA